MSFWLRAALTWLVAAALPMQGVAAATMLHCGQDSTQAAKSHEVASAAGAAAVVAAHHPHHEMNSSDATRPAGREVSSTPSKCGVCAACCIAAALVADVHSFDPEAPAAAFAPALAHIAPVFLTGGPERPPRASIG